MIVVVLFSLVNFSIKAQFTRSDIIRSYFAVTAFLLFCDPVLFCCCSFLSVSHPPLGFLLLLCQHNICLCCSVRPKEAKQESVIPCLKRNLWFVAAGANNVDGFDREAAEELVKGLF